MCSNHCLKALFFGVLMATASNSSFAQDLFFSQFYNTPTLLNPALTGNFKQDVRSTFIHRSQWKNIQTPYATTMFASDMNWKENRLGVDGLGAGFVFADDQLGDGVYGNRFFLLNGALNHYMDGRRRHKLAFGITAGYVQKNLNANGLYYESQYVDGWDLQTGMASGENQASNRYGYFSLDGGAAYDFVATDKWRIRTGLAIHNITRPRESFLDSPLAKVDPLAFRYGYFLRTEFKATDVFTVEPSVYFQYQAGSLNTLAGAMLGYNLDQFIGGRSSTLYLGSWYRFKDAVNLMAGMRYDKFKVAFSYDFTLSGIREVQDLPGIDQLNGQVGAMEISLTYIGFLNRNLPRDLTVPCRFF